MKGESGSPCLIPRFGFTVPCAEPLIKKRVGDCLYALHDQIGPDRVEVELEEDSLNKIPFQAVIGFTHVSLDCH